MGDDYIEIDLEIIHMTSEALFLSDGITSEWVAKSLVRDSWDVGFDDVGRTKPLELEEWVAIEKGFV